MSHSLRAPRSHALALGAWSPPFRLASLRSPGLRAPVLVVAALAVALVTPWVAMDVALAARPWTIGIDPGDAFAYITVNHVVMAAAALALVLALGRPASSWGIAIGRWRLTARHLLVVIPVLLVLSFGYDAAPYLLAGTRPTLAADPTPVAVAGTLAFQWLFVGVAEELFYRGLILGLLHDALDRRRVSDLSSRMHDTPDAPARRRRLRRPRGLARGVSLPAIISAGIFALAHGIFYGRAFFLPVTFDPSWGQLAWTFGLGLYCAMLRERTGSLLGPIAAHNVSNGLVLTMTYLAAGVIRL